MDVFVEHMVKKQSTTQEILLKIFYAVAGLAICAACLYFSMFAQLLGMILPLLGFGAIYGAYILITNMNVEYEYIVTNGEMDVDKIMAKRRRKRLLTANARNFEEFGVYHHADHQSKQYENRVYACESLTAPNSFYAVFKHRTLGRTLLVFTPDDRVIEALKTFVPRQAGGNASYGIRSDRD
jgi:hypothetical protein